MGVAIDVPLIVFVAVLLVCQVDVMLDPGAKMSRHVPKFENDERASDEVVDPTVTAAATRAGEPLHAFALLFPAATAYVTPSLIELLTALSSDVADTNGFGAQGGPRGPNAPNQVTYPFTGFGGVTIDQQHSGTRTYDINTDGVAHYGLYPDWIEDLRRQAGDAIIEDMARGPEAYLQMWERAVGVAPDACRTDVDDLTDANLSVVEIGMRPEDVLWTLGQPSTRTCANFGYCMTGQRTATLTFTPEGTLTSLTVSSP